MRLVSFSVDVGTPENANIAVFVLQLCGAAIHVVGCENIFEGSDWPRIAIKGVPVITTANLFITLGTYFYDLFRKIKAAVMAAESKKTEVKRSRSGKRRQWKPQGKEM